MPDTEISEIDGKINDIGKLEAHVHYKFRGDEELMLRSIFRRVPRSQLAARGGKRERQHGRRHHEFQGQRSGRDPRAVHHVLRCLQGEFPGLVEEEIGHHFAAVQFNLPDVDDDEPTPTPSR